MQYRDMEYIEETEEGQNFIRLVKPEDAGRLVEIYAPYVKQTAVTFEYEVPSVAEFRKRIESILKKYPYLVAEQDGEITGYAYAGVFIERPAADWAAEAAIYVDRGRRRSGAGRALYEALEKALIRQNILNINACIACPEVEDEYLTYDSIRFHERMGYRMAGRFHHWYDLVWMEKHLGEHPAKPEAVKWFAH